MNRTTTNAIGTTAICPSCKDPKATINAWAEYDEEDIHTFGSMSTVATVATNREIKATCSNCGPIDYEKLVVTNNQATIRRNLAEQVAELEHATPFQKAMTERERRKAVADLLKLQDELRGEAEV